ncbi:MAG TPA: TPM domain-containing protein [Bacteroidia bacterium]|nr:TPM domain-containing protein [Bacteroidia bacterium]
MEAYKVISPEEREQLKAAIGKAEKRTSGEIRLFIEDHSEDGPLDRAAFLFNQLKMNTTELRNGVLIYVAFVDRKFSIIGDKGINEKVQADFWDEIKKKMLNHFREGRITNGLLEAIHESGEALAKHFPFNKGDSNELSDDIIFGDSNS